MSMPLAETVSENHDSMVNRPKILSICVHPPQMPGSGGAVRAYHFANALADYGDMTLVCLGGPSGQDEVNPHIREKCSRVIVPASETAGQRASSRPTSRLGSWLRTIKTIGFPWQDDWSGFTSYCLQYCPHSGASGSQKLLGFVFRNEFRLLSKLTNLPPVSLQIYRDAWARVWPQIRELLQRESFSLIFFENSIYYPFAEQVQRQIPGTPVVCNAANIEYKLQERLADYIDDNWQSEWDHSQVCLIKALEKDAFRKCDLVITCSEEDKHLAEQLAPLSKHCVIGNGVDLDYFRPVDQAGTEIPTLLFTGSFRYPPNQDGLRFFVKEVFPLISKERPACRFHFAGFDAQDMYDELQIDDSRISCISSPADIRPCFADVSVFVVPLRIGGGTRLKILEAMSMETAIVSTRIGAEGIPAGDGQHLLLADSPQDFADAVIRLIDNPTLRENMVRDSATWVREHFDWNHLCAHAVAQIKELVAN